MSSDIDDRDRLAPDDAAFVRRVADAYAPPPQSPSRRAAFDAELEARVARDRWRFVPWAAAAAVAGAAALLVLALLPATPAPQVAREPLDAAAEDEFVLAIGGEAPEEFADGLPEEYVAIAGVLEL